MGTLQVSVCDVHDCGVQQALRYIVILPDGKLETDLCTEHAQPLADLRESVPAACFKPTGGPRRRRLVVDPSAV